MSIVEGPPCKNRKMHDFALVSLPVAACACMRNSPGRLSPGKKPEAPTRSAILLDTWLPRAGLLSFRWINMAVSTRHPPDQWL